MTMCSIDFSNVRRLLQMASMATLPCAVTAPAPPPPPAAPQAACSRLTTVRGTGGLMAPPADMLYVTGRTCLSRLFKKLPRCRYEMKT